MQATAPTLTKQEVQQLLTILTGKSSSEQRRHPRHRVAQPVWVKRFAQSERKRNELFKVMLTDASRRGVGFLSKRIFQAGESFVVPLRFAEGGGTLVLCKARFCRTTESGHYRIGAEFAATVPDPEGKAKIPVEWIPD